MTENFYSFADLGAAYEQVLMAQDVAERMCPPGLVRFADATVDVVQNRMRETGIAKGFVDPRVREIMRDPKMGAELVSSLYAYLLSGRNAAQAACRLFVHRNTFDYRIAKIERTIGFELESISDEEAIRLILSCKLLLSEEERA